MDPPRLLDGSSGWMIGAASTIITRRATSPSGRAHQQWIGHLKNKELKNNNLPLLPLRRKDPKRAMGGSSIPPLTAASTTITLPRTRRSGIDQRRWICRQSKHVSLPCSSRTRAAFCRARPRCLGRHSMEWCRLSPNGIISCLGCSRCACACVCVCVCVCVCMCVCVCVCVCVCAAYQLRGDSV
jgi:hypothetical protein